MNATRLVLFKTLMFCFSTVTILSMLLSPTGIMKYQRRFFCGLTAHSMQLGAIAALSLLHCIYLYFRFPPRKLWQKLVLFLMIGLSAMANMASGSRAAFLAGLAALCVFVGILFLRTSSKIRRIIISLAIMSALCYPLWQNSFEAITYKNHGEITNLDLSSREHRWENLLDSFLDSPLFGKGFSYFEEDLQTPAFTSSLKTGQIETGNSWLTVLAMTGILGGIGIVIILWQAAASLLRLLRHDHLQGAFLISVFVFYLLHMCAEGYIFSAGGLMFFSFWLFLGMIRAADAALPRVSYQPSPEIRSQVAMAAPFPGLQ